MEYLQPLKQLQSKTQSSLQAELLLAELEKLLKFWSVQGYNEYAELPLNPIVMDLWKPSFAFHLRIDLCFKLKRRFKGFCLL